MANYKRRYFVGDEFPNKKRLVEDAGRDRFGDGLWVWECSLCGTRGNIPAKVSVIRQGTLAKCCWQRQTGTSSPNWTGYKDISGSALRVYRENALSRGLEWSVDGRILWDIWLRQEGKCALTGIPLIMPPGGSRAKRREGVGTASLDRIDSTQGYSESNLQWVHKMVNRMKSDFSEQEFVAMCKSVAAYHA